MRNRLADLRLYVERVTGIEPAWPAWKTWESKQHLCWSAQCQAEGVPSECLSAIYGGPRRGGGGRGRGAAAVTVLRRDVQVRRATALHRRGRRHGLTPLRPRWPGERVPVVLPVRDGSPG
jgi:hypothetical protein